MICQNETAKLVCVCARAWPCVSVNLLHVRTVPLRHTVSAGELPTVKLMKRATGWVWCGKWLHGSVDMCNCSNWLSRAVLGEIRAAAAAAAATAQAEIDCHRQRVMCMFSLLLSQRLMSGKASNLQNVQ